MEEGSQIGVPFMVKEEVGGAQDKRMKVDGPSWNGLVQSRPKLKGEEAGCMEVQVDMEGGVMVKVELA